MERQGSSLAVELTPRETPVCFPGNEALQAAMKVLGVEGPVVDCARGAIEVYGTTEVELDQALVRRYFEQQFPNYGVRVGQLQQAGTVDHQDFPDTSCAIPVYPEVQAIDVKTHY